MSERNEPDNIFREIAESHIEPYRAEDWAAMRKRLAELPFAQAPQATWRSLLTSYAFRAGIVALLIVLVPTTDLWRKDIKTDAAKSVLLDYAQSQLQKRNSKESIHNPQKQPKNTSELQRLPKKSTQNQALVEKSSTSIEEITTQFHKKTKETTQGIAQEVKIIPVIDHISETKNPLIEKQANLLAPINLVSLMPLQGLEISETIYSHQRNGIAAFELIAADSVDCHRLALAKSNIRYNHLELGAGESFHANLAYKKGPGHLYSIFTLAAQFRQNRTRWGIGYGFGTQLQANLRQTINLELIGFHINERGSITNNLNLLTQARLIINRKLDSRWAVFAGGSLNILASNFPNEDDSVGSKIPAWTFTETNLGATNVKLWLGLSMGVNFQLQK